MRSISAPPTSSSPRAARSSPATPPTCRCRATASSSVRQGEEQLYTWCRAFHFDSEGFLVDPSGGIVQGWDFDATTGQVNRNVPISDMKIPIGQKVDPIATSSLSLIRGNLDAGSPVDTSGRR